jgi:hypothetical protein
MGDIGGAASVVWAPPLAAVTGNNATITVYDTTAGSAGYGQPQRLVVSSFFDQVVTVLVRVKHAGSSSWRTVNGSGDATTASTVFVKDYMVEAPNVQIQVVTGGTGPTTSEIDVGVVPVRGLASSSVSSP